MIIDIDDSQDTIEVGAPLQDATRDELHRAVLSTPVDWFNVTRLANGQSIPKLGGPSPVKAQLTVQNWSLLHFAAWEQRPEYAGLLVARGASRMARDYRGCTPLHAAAGVLFEEESAPGSPTWGECNQKRLYDLLTDGGRILDVKTDDGRTPLHLAVASGNEFATRYLLEHGHTANPQDFRGETPLFYLVQFEPSNWRTMAKLLFQYGADIFVEDNRARVALDEALYVSNWDMLRVLLEKVRQGAKEFADGAFTQLETSHPTNGAYADDENNTWQQNRN